MPDISKTGAPGPVWTFTAVSDRARTWMRQRFRADELTFDESIEAERRRLVAFTTEAGALDVSLTIGSPRARIRRQLHPSGAAGTTLFITHHDEGAGDVYRVERADSHQLFWGGALADAETAAHHWLADQGHVCSAACSGWEPIESSHGA